MRIAVGIILVLGLSIASTVYAEMSSTNFIIRSDSLTSGGDNVSSSSNYILRDSVLQTALGDSSSTSYILQSGLRPEIFDQVVAINVGTQEMDWHVSALSLSGSVITVSSTSGFSVGDLVTLIQDESSTHLASVGKITAISSNTITVDQLVSSSSQTIDGTNDTLYRTNGSSINFQTISTTALAHRVIAWEVSSDIQNGFNVYISDDGDLRDGLNSIDDVSDGTVSAGSEEYGARSSDTSLSDSTFDSEDAAITNTPQQVASVSGASFDSKGLLDLKAAASVLSISGSYANQIYVTAAPTY